MGHTRARRVLAFRRGRYVRSERQKYDNHRSLGKGGRVVRAPKAIGSVKKSRVEMLVAGRRKSEHKIGLRAFTWCAAGRTWTRYQNHGDVLFTCLL